MNLKENKPLVLTLIVAFIGFLDATYLTILHYKNVIPPCTVSGCEVVLTSEYAVVFGIPLSLLGSLFYLSIMGLVLLLLTYYKKIFAYLFYLQATLGFIVSLFLLYLQAFVIKQYCQYCLLSLATSSGIAILALFIYRKSLTKQD